MPPGSPKTYLVFSLNSMYHMFSKLFDSQDLTYQLIFKKVWGQTFYFERLRLLQKRRKVTTIVPELNTLGTNIECFFIKGFTMSHLVTFDNAIPKHLITIFNKDFHIHSALIVNCVKKKTLNLKLKPFIIKLNF